MKKSGIVYALFIIIVIMIIIYGVNIVMGNISTEHKQFSADGYVIGVNGTKVSTHSFHNGSPYYYNKVDKKYHISTDNEEVSLDTQNVAHYQDKSFVTLDNMVAIDLNNVDDELILYYNVFKDTTIKYDKTYNVDSVTGTINFDSLLLRMSDNKYLLLGNNIRLVINEDEVINFPEYIYFEYVDGSIVKLYDQNSFYQTISDDAQLLVEDITINLKSGMISKEGKNYITLSNLVIEKDGNIDIVIADEDEEEKTEEYQIDNPNIDQSILDNTDTSSDGGGSSSSSAIGGIDGDIGEDEEEQTEEVVDETKAIKVPVFRVTSLNLTSLKMEATIEIEDQDNVLNSETNVTIVENASSKIVYETTLAKGDLMGYISYPDLKPDTEYTLYAKASYTLGGNSYEKNFVNKIFRTEALGVSFKQSYVTNNSIVVDISKESYSKVSSANIGIYSKDGVLLDYKSVNLKNNAKESVTFSGLQHNETYMVKMYDIISNSVMVEDGYSVVKNITTLKDPPVIGELTYAVSKMNSSFDLNVSKVTDTDYGVVGYRYEIYDARQNLDTDTPIMTIKKNELVDVNVLVDNNVLQHGVAYTYRLITEFYDNEKTIEYVNDLGKTMQIDGVQFPSVRWEETNVTWEQINGVIVIDDPSNTIMSDTFKIVYKNSVDVYESMQVTAETNTNAIPININYLRANETYTFDVYASINLQDDNPTVTETYIGSVRVQTKSPNKLHAVFAPKDSLTDVFSVNFSLVDDSTSALLEANTLTSLTFTLYQGATTDGKVEVYRKTIDSKRGEYESSLKDLFYNETALINAKFFNKQNNDFKQSTYTLVVDNAYDYTGYDSNIIPITNNVYNFQVNNYIPDIPEDVDEQITVNEILNKRATDFGIDYDDTLDSNTVVGYRIASLYNNAANTAKTITYHVWRFNPITEEYEKLSNLDQTLTFNEDGSVEPAIFTMGHGTANNILDSDQMRRGNKYYFSYEVMIDSDKDGIGDTNYPTSVDENAILKSPIITANKQKSKVFLYPSVSDLHTFSWKYKITDVDKALFENKLFCFKNVDEEASSFADIFVDESDFNVATFIGLNAGDNVTIKKSEKLLKSSDDYFETISTQYFYGYNTSLDISYDITTSDTRSIIVIRNYMDKIPLLKTIARFDAIITPVNEADLNRLGSTTISGLKLEEDTITIDNYDIAKYMGVEIKIDIVAYFDSGATGFDVTSSWKAIQKGSFGEVGSYYISNGTSFVQSDYLFQGMVHTTFNYGNAMLYVEDEDGQNISLQLKTDKTGVLYKNNNILLKEILSATLTSSNNVVQIDNMIPGISLLNESNKINVIPLLTSVQINPKLYGTDVIEIKDDKVYMEIYETDQNGLNAQFIRTIEKNKQDYENTIEIENLKSQTNYYAKFYVYVKNNLTNAYEKVYLYDVDQKLVGVNYSFHTLSDIGVRNIHHAYDALSYNDKRLSISYEIENIFGFEKIKYELYKKTDEGYVLTNINIPDSMVFFNDMVVEIDASPNAQQEIAYGKEYKIRIIPVGKYIVDGVEQEIELGTKEYEFKIDNYKTPYVGISTGKTDTSIYYRVTVTDNSNVIKDGLYDVRLLDSQGNELSVQRNISKNLVNKRFVFSKSQYHLVNEEVYTLVVSIGLDEESNGQVSRVIDKSKDIQFGDSLELGTVALNEKNDEDNSIEVVFSDSYRLDTVSRISYTIASVSTGFYYTGSGDFVTRYDSATDLYYYNLQLGDTVLEDNTLYLVTLNFYNRNNTLLKSTELDYYVGG